MLLHTEIASDSQIGYIRCVAEALPLLREPKSDPTVMDNKFAASLEAEKWTAVLHALEHMAEFADQMDDDFDSDFYAGILADLTDQM